MNEYFVEDEYSFYEIDPECKIEFVKAEKRKENVRKLEAEEYEKYEELSADGCEEGHVYQKNIRR